MNDVIAAALELQSVCQKQGWRFCFKCFANREKDWLDVDGILARQWNKLDLKLARAELKPLAELKEEPEILARLEKKIAHHNQPFTRIKPTTPRKKQR